MLALTEIVDVCITDLIRERDPWSTNFKARKWSEVIGLEQYESIHDLANEIYVTMTHASYFCPEIRTNGPHGIEIIWTGKFERKISIFLSPNSLPKYRFQRDKFIYEAKSLEDVPRVLKVLMNYLNGAGQK